MGGYANLEQHKKSASCRSTMAQNENLKAKILKEKNAKSAHPVRRCGPKETSTAPKAVESSKLTQKESTIIVRPTLGTLTHKDQDRWGTNVTLKGGAAEKVGNFCTICARPRKGWRETRTYHYVKLEMNGTVTVWALKMADNLTTSLGLWRIKGL